jgi:hypothetical protein
VWGVEHPRCNFYGVQPARGNFNVPKRSVAAEGASERSRGIKIVSSTIKSVSYNRETRMLTVRFFDGRIYRFKDVPTFVYKAFRKASSRGAYFNEFIRDAYEYERL